MKDFNYNIKIIKEFEVGEHKLPFLFSLDKIKAFKNDVVMVDSSCVGKYKSDKLSNDYKERIFMYAYMDYIKIGINKDTEEWIKKYEINVEYKIVDNSVIILKPNMFFDLIVNLDCEYNPQTFQKLKLFIEFAEADLMQAFYKNVLSDLEYFKENDTVGSNNTHTFSSLLGETAPNPNPFFTENVGKATIDWSWREVELRDLYKSKTFKIENAIEKLKAKMMEDMKKNKQ